ncbi:D-lactate ferricytochrome c oxidoreductase [Massospora cicadina]|nr:D-lactate ferricytochrome c oxidoreductase [Massospora cicadina]
MAERGTLLPPPPPKPIFNLHRYLTPTQSDPPFTSISHPHLKRHPSYSEVGDGDLTRFAKVLGGHQLIYNDVDALDFYNVDWIGKYRGQSRLVLKPRSVEQVSQILELCHNRRDVELYSFAHWKPSFGSFSEYDGAFAWPRSSDSFFGLELGVMFGLLGALQLGGRSYLLYLVLEEPRSLSGGNTGLVGGSVPVFDEIVLSLSNLNRVRSFDPVSGVIVAEAGCILESLNDYLKPRGFMMPLDLGAKGSCQLGGNLATNAGGLRLLRYGSLHGSTLGLEAVLPDGTILNNLATLRKDNTGYDLKQLLIGSEGTLGVITAAAILTPQLPKVTVERGSARVGQGWFGFKSEPPTGVAISDFNFEKAVNVTFLGVNSYEAVQQVFVRARQQLSEILSAFEFIDNESMRLVKHHASLRDPLASSFPFYVLIETHGSNKDHDDEKLASLLEGLMEDGTVQDGVVAQDEKQVATFWSYRELVPEAVSKHGKAYKYDLSVPLPYLYQVVEKVRAHLESQALFDPKSGSGLIRAVTGYGHVGDGNLHLNVVASEVSPAWHRHSSLMFMSSQVTASYQGSISAEHGVGLQKADYLGYSKSPELIRLMQATKLHYDPHKVLNPYKYLPTNQA